MKKWHRIDIRVALKFIIHLFSADENQFLNHIMHWGALWCFSFFFFFYFSSVSIDELINRIFVHIRRFCFSAENPGIYSRKTVHVNWMLFLESLFKLGTHTHHFVRQLLTGQVIQKCVNFAKNRRIVIISLCLHHAKLTTASNPTKFVTERKNQTAVKKYFSKKKQHNNELFARVSVYYWLSFDFLATNANAGPNTTNSLTLTHTQASVNANEYKRINK